MRVEPRSRYEIHDTELDARGPSTTTPARAREAALSPGDTRDRLAFFAGLHATVTARLDAPEVTPSRDAVVGARLDALRDAFSGPYVVDGTSAQARPMFRMNGGANQGSAKQHGGRLAAIAQSARVNPALISVGQGSPRELVKMTQALIDAGCLPPPPGDVDVRIRQMQWQWGIGVDCAGYTYRAALTASGADAKALGLKPLGWENFRALDGNRAFQKTAPEMARPGDIMTLDPRPPETVGHNVIVRSHTTSGTRHTIEVDSSWGAGADGADYGGFRRDTWIYDDATKLWTSFDAHVTPPVERTSSEGPCDERFHGCYRPKVGT